jgi:gas vesicle protein
MSGLPIWAQMVISIVGGGALGGIAGAVSSVYAARQKIREIEVTSLKKLDEAAFTYRQKLDENSLINARAFLDTLYMPINISLSNLDSQYAELKTKIGSYSTDTEDFRMAYEKFRLACENYVKYIHNLTDEGKDAFLIGEFEERLLSFTDFVKNSLDTKKHSFVTIYVLGEATYDIPSELELDRSKEIRRSRRIELLKIGYEFQKGIFRRFTSWLNLPIPHYEGEKVLAAPITSLAFEKRLSHDIRELKSFIKKVSLGTVPTISANPT